MKKPKAAIAAKSAISSPRLFHLFILTLMIAFAAMASASAAGLKIREKTKFYSIKGKTAAELASAMSVKGPYSFQHRRRAWATAGRKLRYRIHHQKIGKKCKVRRVEMALTITYTMPRARSERRLKRSTRRTWKKMYALLHKHEQVHGRYFKRFAREAYSALRRIPPQRYCRSILRRADKIIDRLDDKDGARNDRFDANDKRNYRRMSRLVGS